MQDHIPVHTRVHNRRSERVAKYCQFGLIPLHCYYKYQIEEYTGYFDPGWTFKLEISERDFYNYEVDSKPISTKKKETVVLQGTTELEKAQKELGKLRKLLVNAGLAKWEPRARDGVMQFKLTAPVVAEVVNKRQ